MFSSQFDTSAGMSQPTESPATKKLRVVEIVGLDPSVLLCGGSNSFVLVFQKSREWNPGLVPVTVKQISEASESASDKSIFAINGVDINNVTLVGLSLNKSMRNTDVSFSLDDGTGQIDCKRWINEAYETKEMEEMDDGMYVRVVGHLKSFQGSKSLAVFSVRPVTNYDEVTFHFLDCIRTHILNTASQLQGGNLTQSVHESSISTPVKSIPSNDARIVISTVQQTNEGIKGNDQLILDFLQQPSNCEIDKGVHRDEIAKGLKLPVSKVMDSIRSLEEEGLIYSTIDEYHYKSTSSY